MQTEFDTIAAISTAPGEGAIGIVRISGDDAIRIADEVYRLNEKRLKDQPSHTIHYGHIVDPKNDEVIDEVMVTVLRAPKTFTREDVVEINCHGGIVAINRILQLGFRTDPFNLTYTPMNFHKFKQSYKTRKVQLKS